YDVLNAREVAAAPHGNDQTIAAVFCGDQLLCTYAFRSQRRGAPDGVLRVWKLPELPRSVVYSDDTLGMPVAPAVSGDGSLVALVQYRAGKPWLVLRDPTGAKLAEGAIGHSMIERTDLAITRDGGLIVVITYRDLEPFRWDGKSLVAMPAIASG